MRKLAVLALIVALAVVIKLPLLLDWADRLIVAVAESGSNPDSDLFAGTGSVSSSRR